MLTHGSLFAGFDGIGRGFERAGIKTIWRVELLDGKDIREQDPLDYDRPDILSGGPPCVNTSAAATLSKQKTNASLWPEMLRFAQALKTKWIVAEQPASVDREIIAQWAQELQRKQSGHDPKNRPRSRCIFCRLYSPRLPALYK